MEGTPTTQSLHLECVCVCVCVCVCTCVCVCVQKTGKAILALKRMAPKSREGSLSVSSPVEGKKCTFGYKEIQSLPLSVPLTICHPHPTPHPSNLLSGGTL